MYSINDKNLLFHVPKPLIVDLYELMNDIMYSINDNSYSFTYMNV